MTDSSITVVTWSEKVSGSLPGNAITITGLGKGNIPNGVLNIEKDGTVRSQNAVILEAHSFYSTGLITGKSLGTVTITASVKCVPDVHASILITVY
ncbi:TPA: hypothetical protein ACX6QU_001343 [Photobacterium damselae]